MNGGKVIYHFEADDSDLKKTTTSVGTIIKGNLISSAITSGLSKVWGGIKNISSAIGGLAVQGGFDRALNIENAEFKLKGLGHSAEETQKIMDNALASVKGTAYGLDEAATVAASAVAAGVQPGQDLERTLKLVGDAAAISGRSMTDMGAIFNKVAAGGKMTGEELNQLTDSGIPMLQLLGQTMGKTNEEVRDLISQGKIGFDEFRNAIEQGMGGAALSMGESFSGALANTKAAMSRLGKTFMDPFLKGMTPALGTLTSIIDDIAAGTTEGLEEKTKLLSEQLGKMLNNVLKTLVPLIKNAIPVITQLIKSLVEMIPDILKTLLPELITVVTEIIEAIVSLLPTLIPILMDGLMQLITSLITMLPTIIQALIDGFILIVKALTEQAPILIPQIVQAILDAILLLLDNVDVLIDCGIQLIFGLIDGIVKAIPILIEKIPEIIDKIVNAIAKNIPKIWKAAVDLIVALAKGLVSAIPLLVSKLPQIGKSIISGLASFTNNMITVGQNLLKGLWKGISNVTGWIIDKIKGFGSSVMKAIKGIFGVHSPSTEFEWVGKMNMLGFEKGMEGMKDQVQSTIDSIFNLQPNVSGQMSSAYSPTMVVNVTNNLETDPLGQLVQNVKTFSGGAKNDYNWGSGL